MEINIRHASEEDIEPLTELIARLKTLNEELDPNFKVVDNLMDEARRYVLETLSDESSFILVAVDEPRGEVVGFIRVSLTDRRFYEPKMMALITDLYVKARYRRRKVGLMLLEKAKEESRRLGAGILAAHYPSYNSIASKFYEKAGFKILEYLTFIRL